MRFKRPSHFSHKVASKVQEFKHKDLKEIGPSMPLKTQKGKGGEVLSKYTYAPTTKDEAKKVERAKGKLSYDQRRHLPTRDFALPKERRYPIENKNHARNALSRVSTYGTSKEKLEVRKAVHKKYPAIGEKASTKDKYEE